MQTTRNYLDLLNKKFPFHTPLKSFKNCSKRCSNLFQFFFRFDNINWIKFFRLKPLLNSLSRKTTLLDSENSVDSNDSIVCVDGLRTVLIISITEQNKLFIVFYYHIFFLNLKQLSKKLLGRDHSDFRNDFLTKGYFDV